MKSSAILKFLANSRKKTLFGVIKLFSVTFVVGLCFFAFTGILAGNEQK